MKSGQLSTGKLFQAKRHNYGVPVGPLPSASGLPDLVVTETYSYSGRGGRVSERTTSLSRLEAQVFKQRFTWDALGNPATLTYPSCLHALCANGFPPERTVTNLYDTGFLTGVSGYASSISYHPNGMLHRLVHNHGVIDTQGIDSSGMARPGSLTSNGSAASWSSGSYSYDGSGNIKSIGSDIFIYDPLSRITSGRLGSASNVIQTYTYDDHGNLTKIVTNGSPRNLSVAVSKGTTLFFRPGALLATVQVTSPPHPTSPPSRGTTLFFGSSSFLGYHPLF